MTQPIDPTMWPKVEGLFPETGDYFRVSPSGEIAVIRCNKGGKGLHFATYYGPITFSTDKTMPQVIDLSHFDLSKIEAKKQPDKPGVWSLANSPDGFPDGISFISQELFDYPTTWDAAEYRFLCDFIPPKQSPVIPPLPTVKLYAVEQLGVVKWCHKSKCGFWTADGLQAHGDPDAVPIAEKVAVVTE